MLRAVRALGLSILALNVLATAAPAQAERRVALVIGNSDYAHTSRLPNPRNDAEDLASALERSGFETMVGLDLDQAGMREIAIRFSRAARGSDVALFYYAGHAMQFGGVNYLMPVDARLSDEADLRRMIRTDEIVADLQEAKALRILVLDACRDNPLATTLARSIGRTRSAALGQGLARIESPEGMIVAFATQSGRVADDGSGRNSPYTAALLKHIETQEEIGTVFRRVSADVFQATGRQQLPELSLSLIGEFYLQGRPTGPAAVAVAALPPSPAAQEWDAVKDTSSEDVLEAFLSEHSEGVFAALARTRLATLREADGPRPEGSAVAPTGRQVTERAPEHRCDRLAASPADEERVGDGVGFEAIDTTAAVPACEEAVRAHSADPRFAFQLGRAFDAAGNHAEAVRWYRQSADRGHAAAMNGLGFMFDNGLGVARDEAEAVRWFRPAAEKGDAAAMTNLGVMFRDGRGVAKDDAEAVRWFRPAAEKGNADAMNNLAWMYENGLGLSPDEAEAVRWYRQAADRGNTIAMNNLGWMYANGRGTARDTQAAARYVFMSLQAKNSFAHREMTTNAVAWGPEFRRELQSLMLREGVYAGPIDGQFGPGTLSAIEALAGQ